MAITRRESMALLGASVLGLPAASSALAAESSRDAAAGSPDPMFTQPYVDVDEWRDAPVRHRYVHGGFKGTETLFSMYFPPKEQYQGRFFQHLMAVSGNENNYSRGVGEDIRFAAASGGYFVESNLGKKDMFPDPDPVISALVSYRASAAVARHSRVLATEMYGPHRPYGYVFGGSGGAFKTISCIESTVGVWDGAVPYIMGSLMSIPYTFTVQAHALRILNDKFAAIVDAADAGGSGDIYAGLSAEEREALAEVTRMGFPPRTWFAHKEVAFHFTGVFATLLEWMTKWDPTYFEDFWKVPGYLGANPTASLLRARIQHKTTIGKVVMSDEAKKMGLPLPMSAAQVAIVPAAFQMENTPQGDLQGASLILKSGAAAGHVLYVVAVVGDAIMVGFGPDTFHAVSGIKAGDAVEIDNSTYLAAQTYHRHQVPTPDYYVWDQFRGPDGKPLYPQRPVELLGPRFAKQGGAISMQTGRFAGKMIVVESLMDEAAFPWNADWYRSRVKAAFGASFDDNYRLWFTDHAMHGATPEALPDNTNLIDYTGLLQQALRDLAAWVEKGVPPPPSTSYKVVDGQLQVPPTAAERNGIQPVVAVTANGGLRAETAVGKPVAFSAVIEAPPGTGKIVAAEWDFEGGGAYPIPAQITDVGSPRATVKATYSFAKPGTYFPALRATSQRGGDVATPFARVRNLGRVRVIVS